MKKLNTVAVLFASVALAAPLSTAFAQAQTNDNWRASDGTVWKNGTNELCWRDANWTPATADPSCDGALKPAAAPAPAPAPAAAPAPAPAPRPAVVPPAPVSEKVTYA
ncbi:MAG: OmpA family protein, partial [Aquincola sp.]|nr:OmpA family protein [Aquincola sp.]